MKAVLGFTDAKQAQAAASGLQDQTLVVADKQSRVVEDAAPLPYTTLDLLEDAALFWGWGGRKTMAEAQTLFEQGTITYPRTDSTHAAPEAIEAARVVIVELYGEKALAKPESGLRSRLRPFDRLPRRERGLRRTPPFGNGEPRENKGKQEFTEEAHEAVRPTDPAFQPEEMENLERDAVELYRLIWQRFLASQMRPARYQIVEVTFRRSL